MARIKHLVIKTPDPEKLAEFYVKVMGLVVTHRSENGNISVSDGYFDLSIHTNKFDKSPSGLDHFGFEVDDFEPFLERCKQYGFSPPNRHKPVRPFAEYRGTDPGGNNFDLSTKGYFHSTPAGQSPDADSAD